MSDALTLLATAGPKSKLVFFIESTASQAVSDLASVYDPVDVATTIGRHYALIVQGYSSYGKIVIPNATVRQLNAFVSVSLETYFMSLVHSAVMAKLRLAMAGLEAKLNRVANVLVDASLEQLGGPTALAKTIARSVDIVRKIEAASTPLEMIILLRTAMERLGSDAAGTTDAYSSSADRAH